MVGVQYKERVNNERNSPINAEAAKRGRGGNPLTRKDRKIKKKKEQENGNDYVTLSRSNFIMYCKMLYSNIIALDLASFYVSDEGTVPRYCSFLESKHRGDYIFLLYEIMDPFFKYIETSYLVHDKMLR